MRDYILQSNSGFSKNFLKIKFFFDNLQITIKKALESLDDFKFKKINWKHFQKGGGKTLIIENKNLQSDYQNSKKINKIFEKIGLNVSGVGGKLSQNMMEVLHISDNDFNACGISLVLHPFSPMIPTVHMNLRYFEMSDKSYWFGGGIDLTPYYPYEEDFVYFHSTIKKVIDKIYPKRYYDFKKNCDDYFTIRHRLEMRGVGGVFFDYLKNNYQNDFSLIQAVGNIFLDAYLPIVKKRRCTIYGTREKNFQFFRRGRYVEFNFLYDRGTKFGLESGGRIDSIFISLPLHLSFPTIVEFDKDGFESKMLTYYQPRIWV
jgi:coproporphyrinogen III oxidase